MTNNNKKEKFIKTWEDCFMPDDLPLFYAMVDDLETSIAQARQSTIDEVIGLLEKCAYSFECLTKKAYVDGSVEYFTNSMQAKMYRLILKQIQSLSKKGGSDE